MGNQQSDPSDPNTNALPRSSEDADDDDDDDDPRGEEEAPDDDDDDEVPGGVGGATRRLSYWELAKFGYQELVNAIIRPPRAEYDAEHLGPDYFEWHGRCYQRVDFELVNPRGLKLACSHWMPVERPSTPRPCLVYLHGNASARVEGVSQLALCLSIGITLVAFDFSGSGHSEGEWVSLGYWERDDLATVIAHLRATGSVSSIALWGRSMGAVCALMHGARDPSVAAMICDGAFADLPQLAEELVDKARDGGLAVPGFVASLALRMIRSSVLKTAKFKLEDVAPVKHVASSFVPALFVAGEHDDFVAAHHSRAIHAKYAGDKNLVMVEGDHNSPRPRFLFDSAAIFLQTYMDVPLAWTVPGADAFNAGVPPWVDAGAAVGLNLADLGLDLADVDRLSGGLDLGMTTERQLQVQQTLATVLGGGQPTTTHAGTASSSSSARRPPPGAASTSRRRGSLGGSGGPPRGRRPTDTTDDDDDDDDPVGRSEGAAAVVVVQARSPFRGTPAFDEVDAVAAVPLDDRDGGRPRLAVATTAASDPDQQQQPATTGGASSSSSSSCDAASVLVEPAAGVGDAASGPPRAGGPPPPPTSAPTHGAAPPPPPTRAASSGSRSRASGASSTLPR